MKYAQDENDEDIKGLNGSGSAFETLVLALGEFDAVFVAFNVFVFL